MKRSRVNATIRIVPVHKVLFQLRNRHTCLHVYGVNYLSVMIPFGLKNKKQQQQNLREYERLSTCEMTCKKWKPAFDVELSHAITKLFVSLFSTYKGR